MDSRTLISCNRRYIVSAIGDRITTRRTNEALTPLKPDYLGHKGEVTHLAIHQPDHCHGTQDDWGRVVASSDTTNRVKVWLCDGEEEELMFARNMAEYVGYENITAIAWTGDSKVAIGDASGNYIVFNARYATSRYNRTVSKAITSIAPSQTDPHIHALGYEDGSILLIRTNPSFQIIFTNNEAHTGPIASLAWRPEFSAPRTYTEKDGKVHKSSAEDMALLASCPHTRGEFRIWAWSSKNEKLSAFRDEQKSNSNEGQSNHDSVGQLQWSRNGKVVQFLQGEVRVWDVRKLQIQSELLLASSEGIQGVAVDGHRGLIYTLDSTGVQRHTIPAKAATQSPPTSIPVPVNPATSVPIESNPQESSKTPSPEPAPPPPPTATPPISTTTPTPPKLQITTDLVTQPEPQLSHTPLDTPNSELSLPIPTIERTPSIDSLTRVKQMAKQFDEDPVLNRKRSNNFIANAKAMYSGVGRKRTVSGDSGRSATPEPQVIGKTTSSSNAGRHPSIFEIATGVPKGEGVSRLPVRSAERKVSGEIVRKVSDMTTEKSSDSASERSSGLSVPEMKSSEPSRAPTPEAYLRKDSISKEAEMPSEVPPPIPEPQPQIAFKSIGYGEKRNKSPPIKVATPLPPKETIPTQAEEEEINPPAITRARKDSIFVESPVLGDAAPDLTRVSQVSLPTPPTPITPPTAIPQAPNPLEAIPEEAQPLKIPKPESHLHRAAAMIGLAPQLDKFSSIKASPPKAVELPALPSPPKMQQMPWMISSTPSSSASSNLAEPLSSSEDLGKYSTDEARDPYNDARSDTSVEQIGDSKPSSLKSLTIAPTSEEQETTSDGTQLSPTLSKRGSRASRIWAEKNGKNIHTHIADYVEDTQEATPSPLFKSEPKDKPSVQSSPDSDIPLDSPTPYKHSLREYDLFRSLTKKMSQGSKERLEKLMSTKPLTQKNICKAFFGFSSIVQLLEEELNYAKELNIGLSELILTLWLGKDLDDESLLRAILFGKTNGLADISTEVWESLMLWCSEIVPPKMELSCEDIVKGNNIVRTHIFAAFLYYNGSSKDAIAMYRRAKMYREAILLALMDICKESVFKTVKELFRSWGDQVAAEDGDGLLVSMCFAASMMEYESLASTRKQSTIVTSPTVSTRSASPEVTRPRKASDALPSPAITLSRKPSPVIPVIRTQKPSPTESTTSAGTKKSSQPDSPRNWAELASFMRKQRQIGYTEVRSPKTVQFAPEENLSRSVSPVPPLPRPRYPEERGSSRSSSPSGRKIPARRYVEDEDWSRPPRPALRGGNIDRYDRAPSPSPRVVSGRNSPMPDGRRRVPHEMSSPLAFGARGASIKLATPTGQEPPPLPVKDEKREKAGARELRKAIGMETGGERSRYPEMNGVGLGINGHGVRERVARA